MAINFTKLSQVISHALRHEPWLYELELDTEGWVSLNSLVDSLRLQHKDWKDLSENDVVLMINSSDKRRHEILNNRIRALYGHSLPGKLKKTEAIPPNILFHGTSPKSAETIKLEGIKPMNRQYVHLSTNQEIAYQVGKRKSSHPIILTIQSFQAYSKGVKFYEGNEMVWLSDYIAPEFIGENK
jgi:putative RNA 2'-phosphotransferase